MDPLLLSTFLFWSSAALLIYTFVGYSSLMRFRARGLPAQPDATPPSHPPRVSVIVVAYNEEARIATRIKNLLQCEYPAERLSVVIVSDGSTDRTAAMAGSIEPSRVRVIEQPCRM